MIPREFYAEEIETTCGLTTPALVRAFATVPREEFVGPGPWMVQGGGDLFAPARRTADADRRRVYHNLSIVIDPERQLYNGAPGVVATWLDALALASPRAAANGGCEGAAGREPDPFVGERNGPGPDHSRQSVTPSQLVITGRGLLPAKGGLG